MKHLKLFEDYKLWVEIEDDEEYDYNTINFDKNIAEEIVRRLNKDWCGKLVRHSGTFLDLRMNNQTSAIAIHETDDEYFLCEVDDNSTSNYKCDSKIGLIQFLQYFDVIT